MSRIVRSPDDGTPVVAPPPDTATEVGRPGRLGSVARRLTLVNLSYTGVALVTSPLQAHALGPSGRGELAAVTVVIGLVALVGDLGLSSFTVRESARGTPTRKLVGSVGPMLLGVGLIYAGLSWLIAGAVAGDRETVYWLVLVAMLTMPLTMPSAVTMAVAWGQQRWGIFTLQRLIPPIGLLLACVVLYAMDRLTVATAGIVFIVTSVLAPIPSYITLRGAGRPSWDPAVAREAIRYGARVWLTQLANHSNARLDQLLMTRLVPSSELGLYVIAVNVSLIQSSFTVATCTALLPRVSAGDAAVAARAIRVMLAITTILSLILLVTVPIFLPFVFGAAFSDAVVMCQILVVAAIPLGALQVLTVTLNGIGEPGVAARGELISLAITIPALLLFVGRYGGEAAATTSLVAYTVTMTYLAVQVRRRLGLGWAAMFIPRRSDLEALTALPLVGRLIARRRH